MRDFVWLGFNQAVATDTVSLRGIQQTPNDANEDDNSQGNENQSNDCKHVRVFDGVLNWKAGGSHIFVNKRFAQPFRTERQHIARWTPEVYFPFANQTVHDPVTGKHDGFLRLCRETGTCPKMIEANTSNEFWAKAGSNLLTDPDGNDLHQLKNVRYYVEASAPHVPITGLGFCAQPRNPLAAGPLLRALMNDLDQWAGSSIAPPDSQTPRVDTGTLVDTDQSVEGFPNIPGVTYNGVHTTGDLWDFGPRFDQGIMDVLPPNYLGSPYPSLVPKVDADGNDVGGVRMPNISVPTATYTGWNLRLAGGGDECDAFGMKIPFPATAAAAAASGDPRVSLADRYPSHQAYVDAVTAAANDLQAQRFVLAEDAAAYVAAAQASTIGN
jgi:hypothetical protein